jgi:redox-sensitive bicupin YhaK (pirin superfamily)
MKTRSVSHLLYAQPINMGGLPVRQAFPTQQVQQLDPFLLLHHARVKAPQHTDPRHAGVDPHPHRGFSPVTFVFEGGVHHRDSRGNNGTVYAGGAQWMHAGRGIIHSERPPHDIHERGSYQEIIQLWVNSPAKNKFDLPSYYPAHAEDVPEVKSEDGLSTLRVFAGTLQHVSGKITPVSAVNAATVFVKENGRFSVALPAHHNAFLYLLDGAIMLDKYGLVEGHHAVLFKQDGEGIALEAKRDTRMLLMSGEPIGEPVVSHGPFVMNTQTEILEAMRDYQLGKMGVLIED